MPRPSRRPRLPLLALSTLALGAAGLAGLGSLGSAASGAPAPADAPLRVFFGTTHAHTGAGNDHGKDDSRPADVFAAAKGAGLDFLFLTEHAGPTGAPDQAAFYAEEKAAAAVATDAGSFVGLAGYEYSENNGDDDKDSGHLTAVGTDTMVNAMSDGMDYDAFENLLVAQNAEHGRVFGGFNHPAAGGHPAAAASLLTPARREVMALSETSNKVGYNADTEAQYYAAYVAELDTGWRVAPTCGLDTHGLVSLVKVETDEKKPCRTGLLMPSLTRSSVYAAVADRRVYSTRDTNLVLDYTVDGQQLGSELPAADEATFDISVSDPDVSDPADAIRRIEIIGDGGDVVAAKTFEGHDVSWSPTVSAAGRSYLFVRVFNGERDAHTAVAAPVWFG